MLVRLAVFGIFETQVKCKCALFLPPSTTRKKLLVVKCGAGHCCFSVSGGAQRRPSDRAEPESRPSIVRWCQVIMRQTRIDVRCLCRRRPDYIRPTVAPQVTIAKPAWPAGPSARHHTLTHIHKGDLLPPHSAWFLGETHSEQCQAYQEKRERERFLQTVAVNVPGTGLKCIVWLHFVREHPGTGCG